METSSSSFDFYCTNYTRLYYDIIIVYENRLLNVLRNLRIILIPSEDIITFIELHYNVINTCATICFIFIYVYQIIIYVPTINLEYDYLPTRVMRGRYNVVCYILYTQLNSIGGLNVKLTNRIIFKQRKLLFRSSNLKTI